jgi:hypothetical protein
MSKGVRKNLGLNADTHLLTNLIWRGKDENQYYKIR